MTSEASGSRPGTGGEARVRGTGLWWGAGRLRAGLKGTRPRPHSPEGSTGAGVRLPMPSHPHDPHSAAPPHGAAMGPQTVQPVLPPWALIRPPAAAATREHPPTLGPQCFLLHKRVDSVPPREGWREGTGGDWLQCAGSLAHRAASDFVQPRSVLCVCVPCLCACKRASVDSPRNMHFGTRLVTSHTSFSLRPCFNLKR